MSERLIIATTPSGYLDTVAALADAPGVYDCRVMTGEAGEAGEDFRNVHFIVDAENRQALLDQLQHALGGATGWRLTLLPVEATLPRPEPEAPVDGRQRMAGESREEIYSDVSRGARADRVFFILVVLSTVVAAIGLIENNVTVIIGAMVIAPLLGPNLAFSLGVALGDRKLMGRAMLTNAMGVSVTLSLCVLVGMLYTLPDSRELLARTDVGVDGVVLALASGAAAVLSLTSGLSATLVGVMVAVALLPPAATMGLMAGAGNWTEAFGAAMLLAVNVVALNLAAQVMLVLRGITPRTWLEKQAARRAVRVNIAVWLALLLVLTGLIVLKTLRD